MTYVQTKVDIVVWWELDASSPFWSKEGTAIAGQELGRIVRMSSGDFWGPCIAPACQGLVSFDPLLVAVTAAEYCEWEDVVQLGVAGGRYPRRKVICPNTFRGRKYEREGERSLLNSA